MKEVVQRVLKEEECARVSLEKARGEANGIIVKAKKDSEALVVETVNQVKESIAQRITESAQEFLAEKENVLAASKQQAAALRKAREKDIPDISRKVFLEIINIED